MESYSNSIYKRKATGNYKSKCECFIWGPHSLEKPSTLLILWMSFGIINYLHAQPSYMTLAWVKQSTQRSYFGTLVLLNKCILHLKTAPSTQGLYTVIDKMVPERYACWHILVFEDNILHLQAKHWPKDYDCKINIMLLLNCRNKTRLSLKLVWIGKNNCWDNHYVHKQLFTTYC